MLHHFLARKVIYEDVFALIEQNQAVFSFNEYEHLICNLIDKDGMSYDQYIEIKTEYISENPNPWIFEISVPHVFGKKFAQTYVQGKCSKLKKPSKTLDPAYTGEYDLWIDGIAIEVKASRAVNSDSDEPLYMKALSRHTKKRFLMNFQQLKPQCCDVFIWVAVFRDEIVLWIMTTNMRSKKENAVGRRNNQFLSCFTRCFVKRRIPCIGKSFCSICF